MFTFVVYDELAEPGFVLLDNLLQHGRKRLHYLQCNIIQRNAAEQRDHFVDDTLRRIFGCCLCM